MSDMKLSILELAPFINGDQAARHKVARTFGEALETTGFTVIVGHGVPLELATSLYGVMKEYFAKPLHEKLLDLTPEKTKRRGYFPIGIESVAKTLTDETPPDLCEALTFTAPHREGFGARPNIWPSNPPPLKTLVEAWTAQMIRLTGHLSRLSALALGLPEHYFAQTYADDPMLILRFVHYPDQFEPPAKNQLRYGAHHDYGGLTILRQDNAPGGLEICDVDGVWREAGVVPDSFVINIGDLMSQWTNGRWRSTLHRVSNPDRALVGSSARLSMVAFTGPNESAEVRCLPSCCDADHPPRYEPVRAGDYIVSKLAASMDLASARSSD
jgi:isopenicillin N synthase-like dioxygenase